MKPVESAVKRVSKTELGLLVHPPPHNQWAMECLCQFTWFVVHTQANWVGLDKILWRNSRIRLYQWKRKRHRIDHLGRRAQTINRNWLIQPPKAKSRLVMTELIKMLLRSPAQEETRQMNTRDRLVLFAVTIRNQITRESNQDNHRLGPEEIGSRILSLARKEHAPGLMSQIQVQGWKMQGWWAHMWQNMVEIKAEYSQITTTITISTATGPYRGHL